jgi:Heterokaryon incompatibility protein (HET)
VIIFAKQQGHLATGITPPEQAIQMEIKAPTKPGTSQLNATSHEKYQQDTHDWIEELYPQSDARKELYTTLPSKYWFRLLVIEPGSEKSLLKCQLLPMELEKAKSRYEALSYCWGLYAITPTWWTSTKKKSSKFENIICNGSNVEISSNLGTALYHIRHPRPLRVIWADALCINQTSEEERAEQVTIMDSIYSNASRTLIWTGNSRNSGNPESGLYRICQIVNTWDTSKPANFRFFDPKSGRIRFHKPTTDLPKISESKLIQSLQVVFDSPWFHRRWVIQEVVLAKSVELLIGYFSISWTWVGLAAALLRTQYGHLITKSIRSESRIIRHAMNAYFMFRLSPGYEIPALDIELLTLLRLASSFKNTNPLDTIYALRGLIKNIRGIDLLDYLKVDYSLKEEQLLIKLTDLLICSKKAPLDFLSDAGTEPIIPQTMYWGGMKKEITTATWIPRWVEKSRTLLDLWAVDERFEASRGLQCERLVSRSPMHLAINGIFASTVMWRGDVLVFPFIENGTIGKSRPAVRYILSLILSGAFKCSESTHLDGLISTRVLEVFARVLTAGRDSQSKRDTTKRANVSSFAALLLLILEPENTLEYSNLSAIAGNINPDKFLQIAETLTVNRTLFVTMQGHLGLGPVEMKAGDKIYVFGGASMPFVLRKVASEDISNNLYKLIGECYIDGIMDGETVDAMKEKQNLCGHFVPRILLETLYNYPSLKDEGKELMRKVLNEVLQVDKQVHAKLDISAIELE